MEFRILGPTEVLDGGRWVLLPSGRGRALLAVLALHAGDPVSADRLIDELWGENPPPRWIDRARCSAPDRGDLGGEPAVRGAAAHCA